MDVSVDNRFALQEIFVYRRFKSIMITFLVRNLKTYMTCHLVRFRVIKYSAGNVAEKKIFKSTNLYDLMIIFHKYIQNVFWKLELFI